MSAAKSDSKPKKRLKSVSSTGAWTANTTAAVPPVQAPKDLSRRPTEGTTLRGRHWRLVESCHVGADLLSEEVKVGDTVEMLTPEWELGVLIVVQEIRVFDDGVTEIWGWGGTGHQDRKFRYKLAQDVRIPGRRAPGDSRSFELAPAEQKVLAELRARREASGLTRGQFVEILELEHPKLNYGTYTRVELGQRNMNDEEMAAFERAIAKAPATA